LGQHSNSIKMERIEHSSHFAEYTDWRRSFGIGPSIKNKNYYKITKSNDWFIYSSWYSSLYI